jgi:hypothetical protein
MEYDFIKLLFGLGIVVLVSIGVYVAAIFAIDEFNKAKSDLEDLKARLLLMEAKLKEQLIK